MKLIIAGSRSMSEKLYPVVEIAVIKYFDHLEVTEIVSGGAKGADYLGEKFAEDYGLPCTVFKADWDTYGKRAGPRRNLEMAEYADALICFPSNKSKGTWDMVKKARTFGLSPIHIIDSLSDLF